MKNKITQIKQLFCILLFSFTICLSVYTLKHIKHQPTKALYLSKYFTTLLMTNRLKEAYSLTNKNAIIGTTLEGFKNRAIRNAPTGRLPCKLHIDHISPKQSYGNRLRRYLNKAPLDVEILYIDYDICQLPFMVTLKHKDTNNWEIINFETHAE